MTAEPARPEDAPGAAELADAKRREYEPYSPVFWRVAPDARQVHEPWLATCIADTDSFTSFAVRNERAVEGIVIAAHDVFPPPFRHDAEPSWLVDDFYVTSPVDWQTTGVALLEAVEAAARAAGATRTIVLAARKDGPKGTMLRAQGYRRGASWWIRAVDPTAGEKPELLTVEAVTGPAPPVYDPGGTTALALRVGDPGEVSAFVRWSSASDAVLAIVPARASEPELEAALAATGFEPASDWWTKHLS